MSNQLTKMAKELLIIEDDLSHRIEYVSSCSPSIDDFELHTFEQIWSDTSCGVGGELAGQAFTKARTYVFIPNIPDQDCLVYFGFRFAYAVPFSQCFMKDVRNKQMAHSIQRNKYVKAAEEEFKERSLNE